MARNGEFRSNTPDERSNLPDVAYHDYPAGVIDPLGGLDRAAFQGSDSGEIDLVVDPFHLPRQNETGLPGTDV